MAGLSVTPPCDERWQRTLSGPARGAGRNWQELLATVLLVLAALGTSWSSYQATRWNGEQAAAAGRTNAIRIEAARAQGLAEAQTQVDVATFIAWADADQRGEQELAEFYVDRFRDEFQPAFDAWIATKPAHQRRGAADPVRHGRVPARRPGTRPSSSTPQAEASAAEVRLDIQRSSNYVLTVVLYAIVLFFAGMSTRVDNRTPALGAHHRRLPRPRRRHRLDRHLPRQPRDLTPRSRASSRVQLRPLA